MSDECGKCRFWISDHPDGIPGFPEFGGTIKGTCHRNAPVTVQGLNAIRVMLVDFHWEKFAGKTASEGSFGSVDDGDESLPYWPVTGDDDWCGDFAARGMVKPLD